MVQRSQMLSRQTWFVVGVFRLQFGHWFGAGGVLFGIFCVPTKDWGGRIRDWSRLAMILPFANTYLCIDFIYIVTFCSDVSYALYVIYLIVHAIYWYYFVCNIQTITRYKSCLADPNEPNSRTSPPIVRSPSVSTIENLDESLVSHQPKILPTKKPCFTDSEDSNDDHDLLTDGPSHHHPNNYTQSSQQPPTLIDLSNSDDELAAHKVPFKSNIVPSNITLLDATIDETDDDELLDGKHVNQNQPNFKTLSEKEINKL